MAERVRRHAMMVKVLSFHEVGQRLPLLLLAAAQKARVDKNGSVMVKLDFSNHEIAIRIGPAAMWYRVPWRGSSRKD